MYYTVYKTTNKINGRYYIGKHKTSNINDSYLGSGKLLRSAIAKYGFNSFEKTILFVFDNEQEMNDKERELVTEDFVNSTATYNLVIGGKGGFSYINSSGLKKFHGHNHSSETVNKIRDHALKRKHSDETIQKISKASQLTNASRGRKVSDALSGKSKSDDHKRKISEAIKESWRKRKAAIV